MTRIRIAVKEYKLTQVDALYSNLRGVSHYSRIRNKSQNTCSQSPKRTVLIFALHCPHFHEVLIERKHSCLDGLVNLRN